MISAFGIEHGEISKSYTKLAPKLRSANRAYIKAKPDPRSSTMDERIRENYAEFRWRAGLVGSFRERGDIPNPLARDNGRKHKEVTHAMVTAAGNRSKRAGRWLP